MIQIISFSSSILAAGRLNIAAQIGPRVEKKCSGQAILDGQTDNYRVPAEWSPNKLSTCINNYIEGSKVTILYTSPTPAFHVLVGINMQISPSHDYHLQ